MTDVFTTQEQAPAAAPAIEATASPAAAPERTAFDDSLDDFLNRDLLAEMDGKPEVPPPPAPVVPAAAAQPAAPGVAQAAPAAAPIVPQPAPANGGTPPAATTQPAPAGETAPQEVNPELLLQMFGGDPAPPPAQPSTPAVPAAQPDADAVPMPFTSAMQLPPQLVSAIFESEDPVQRTQALTGLMAALGNAVVGFVEERMTSHHAPRMANQFQAAQSASAQAAAVSQHFYGANPDLAQYRQVVERAGRVYLAANPQAQYNEQTAQGIAALARSALAQMGTVLQPAAPAAPATPAAPARQPASPYVAGGASPGGSLETPLSQTSPAGVFDQMMGSW